MIQHCHIQISGGDTAASEIDVNIRRLWRYVSSKDKSFMKQNIRNSTVTLNWRRKLDKSRIIAMKYIMFLDNNAFCFLLLRLHSCTVAMWLRRLVMAAAAYISVVDNS